MWKSEKRVELIIQSQNPIFLLDKRKKPDFWRAIVGTRIWIRYLCHVSYPWPRIHYRAEGVTHLDNRVTSVARYQRRLYYREWTSGKGLALTWLKGWWLSPHLMHPIKPPSCIYVEKTPEQCCLGCPNSQGIWEGVWWDKHSSSSLENQQMEGQDHLKRAI